MRCLTMIDIDCSKVSRSMSSAPISNSVRAQSIDWARTLLLMGAEDIDRETFNQSMSIIVKHRTDIDLVAERVGVKLADPLRPQA